MRNPLIKYSLYLFLIIVSGCTCGDLAREYPESFSIEATNKIVAERKESCVFLDIVTIKEQHPDFNPMAFVVLEENKELPSQMVNSDIDGKKIIFLADFAPKETKNLTARYAKESKKEREYPKKTQAILSIKCGGKWEGNKYAGGTFKDTNYLKAPPAHTDHSEFIRFEGPGWESDKVGYRLYLDWRNGIDIFGKKVSSIVLKDVGQDGYQSYHEMSPWGMDILKVGDALGIGAAGMWNNGKVERISKTDSLICEILENGVLYSQLGIKYMGWKTDSKEFNLTSNLSITAGSRLTKHDIIIDKDIDNLCTGIVKSEGINILKSEDKQTGWGYLASYGNQSIIGDKLGMAILYQNEDKITITEDELNEAVILNAQNGMLTYYFLAAWEQEPNGIKNEEEFIKYLETTIKELDSPISIEITQSNN
ncbi:DUF4861 domain-containing protein [candidate division WOR-3 bacterium]|nr:DUF4861 domain-containing protein [candidate division WOR-3 bacterium]